MSLTPTQKLKVRQSIGGYCKAEVGNELRIRRSPQ